MGLIELVAERKIQEAIERGEFDHLPGMGKPLPAEQANVPDDLRSTCKILKNANVLPEEMQVSKRIHALNELLAQCEDEEKAQSISRELNELELRYDLLMERRGETGTHRKYRKKIISRFH